MCVCVYKRSSCQQESKHHEISLKTTAQSKYKIQICAASFVLTAAAAVAFYEQEENSVKKYIYIYNRQTKAATANGIDQPSGQVGKWPSSRCFWPGQLSVI